MNPRAVAAWCVSSLFIALATSNPIYRLIVVLAALNVLLALRRPDARIAPLIRAVSVAGAIATALTFAVSHTGTHTLFGLPQGVPVLGGAFTLESLTFGAVSGLGVAAAVLAVAPLSLVAQPHELVDALPRALSRSGQALATAINLIPALARSAGEIRDAQRLRGLHPSRRSALADVAVPVVLTAVEDSVRVAEAMEARGYGSGPRTHFGEVRWSATDTVLTALSLAAAMTFVLLRAAGAVPDWYPFPTLTVPAANPVAVVACLALAAPALIRR